jgi:hypothetical protein
VILISGEKSKGPFAGKNHLTVFCRYFTEIQTVLDCWKSFSATLQPPRHQPVISMHRTLVHSGARRPVNLLSCQIKVAFTYAMH